MTTSDPTRYPLAEAEQAAAWLVEQIEHYAERVLIAGSIRRRKPTVKDIEILVEPTVDQIPADLFGEATAEFVPLYGWLDGVLTPRLDVHGRRAWGPRYRRALFLGYPLDLFIVRDPDEWGLLAAIRTGPAAFSRKLVTSRSRGGFLPPGWRVQERKLRRPGGAVVPTPEEADVFAALGIPWQEPEARG